MSAHLGHFPAGAAKRQPSAGHDEEKVFFIQPEHDLSVRIIADARVSVGDKAPLPVDIDAELTQSVSVLFFFLFHLRLPDVIKFSHCKYIISDAGICSAGAIGARI